VQLNTLKTIWEQYRAQAKTSRRLKEEQGGWRRILLWATVAALLATPFSKTLAQRDLPLLAGILSGVAAVLFALIAWLNKEVLGDNSQQAWVRARQTAEGCKALAFRFLGGVPPLDGPDAADVALKRGDELVTKSGRAADRVDPAEREQNLPPAPLRIDEYVKCRLDDQVKYFEDQGELERKREAHITTAGRLISLAVVVFGALSAFIARQWQDIWVPALGLAATMVAAQTTKSRHRFLVDSYARASVKLKFAKAAWGNSAKSQADADRLIAAVESILADENAGWVQEMLVTPVVPDKPSDQGAAGRN
jgi:hypothetical protein